jgi:hypothetical protein
MCERRARKIGFKVLVGLVDTDTKIRSDLKEQSGGKAHEVVAAEEFR